MHFHRLCLKNYYCRGTCSTAFNQLCHYRGYAIYNIQRWILLCFRYNLYFIIICLLVYILYSVPYKTNVTSIFFWSIRPNHKLIFIPIKIFVNIGNTFNNLTIFIKELVIIYIRKKYFI